ncbi:hypothetical protein DICPUDRAFT_146960 [Dictyostelium purpureum]|uniref:Glycosyltransferase 2-like domain-containing protein n=1 Tax=Dictyostelium purpureum TaxID=5786 RepID=F0Z7A8_DICPU|nr:uncharacterized protein DICPUDRAFT_146960 [Dictyostelium purpureum]EGC40144.1 hypothetical protein DICPUDRAFT_146960 [Dictyostelium purpureum]|eukprot:XP_003283334.1 hypothetical protein DICPUDRAFT_146960 [Dictyostelium purpureum]
MENEKINNNNNSNNNKIVKFKYGCDQVIEFGSTVHELLNQIEKENITTTLPICLDDGSIGGGGLLVKERDYTLPMVSFAVCMKNASKFLDETLFSIVLQTYRGPLELSIFDDASTDTSIEVVLKWLPVFKYFNICLVLSSGKGSETHHHNMKEYIEIIEEFKKKYNISTKEEVTTKDEEEKEIVTLLSGGVGYARNQAIKYSHGEYLCILDADDVMFRERVESQYQECKKDLDCIVGSNFIRIPEGSSARYTDWCNRLSDEQLFLHQYREVSIIQPTWFYHRTLFLKNGEYIEALKLNENINDNNNNSNNINNNNNETDNKKFYIMGSNDNCLQYKHKNQDKHIEKYKESQKKLIKDISSSGAKAIPEDLIFFNRHLDKGGKLRKAKIESIVNISSNQEKEKTEQDDATENEDEQCNGNKKLKIIKNEPLLVYRYHENNLSSQIHKHMLMKVRIEYLERRVLSKWSSFTIWGAGKDGKKFFTLLSDSSKKKVTAFCDVDKNKIGQKYNAAYTPYSVPIIHFSQAKPPLVICVALDRSNGEFENNLNSLNLKEGTEYWHFN